MPVNSNIILIEASPTDAETAYVISAGRNDLHPYIFRTHDAGKTWQLIVNGLPADAIARADWLRITQLAREAVELRGAAGNR